MSRLMKTQVYWPPFIGAKTFTRTSIRYLTTSPTVTTLPNGIRVVTEKNNTKTTSVGVYIGGGTSAETSSNNGITYLLSRIAFKGNLKSTPLVQTAEGLGAQLRSTANRKYLSLTAQGFNEDVSKLIKILSEASQNFNTSEEVLREAKNDIAIEDNVDPDGFELMSEHLHSVAYQVHSLAYGIRGSPESREAINSNTVQEFLNKTLAGNRTVISVVGGGAEHDQVVEQVKSAFGSFPSVGETPGVLSLSNQKENGSFIGSMVTLRDDDDEGAVLSIGFEGPGISSPDYVPLLLAQNVIGNWDLSLAAGQVTQTKFAEQVRQDQTADSFHTFSFPYAETGLYGVYLYVKDVEGKEHHRPGFYHILVSAVYGAYHRIGFSLGEGELQLAKLRAQLNLSQQFSSNEKIAQFLASQAFNGDKIISLAQLSNLIDSADSKTIKEATIRYANDTEPVIAAKGCLRTFPDYNLIRTWTWQPYF